MRPWLIVNGWHILASFDTEGGAKRSRTRKWSKRYPNCQVVSCEWFDANEPMVETYDMLNPDAGTFLIPASQKGTCCDPGTERYHCM